MTGPHPLVPALGLEPHPEGGWYRQTWRSAVLVQPAGYSGPRAAATAIEYLLPAGETSRWHRVRSDELWLWQGLGPLRLRYGGSGAGPDDEATEHVVVGPDPTAVFFGDSYVNHRDHREVGWAVLDAVAPAASSPLYFPDQGPPHQVGGVLLSGTLEPDAWVDVTATIEQKITAVACHESRLGGDPDLVRQLLRARTAESGVHAGVAHAEGYRRLRFA